MAPESRVLRLGPRAGSAHPSAAIGACAPGCSTLIRIEQMAKVLFAEDNHMIKAIPPDRTDQPLRVSILPRRPCRAQSVPYAHCLKAPNEGFAISTVSVTNEISRYLVPATGFSHLSGNPFGTRMGGHTQPHKLATRMAQDQKSIQQPKRNCRENEHVHRCDGIGMIANKRPPTL